jgi:hypothetical protein
MPPWICLPPATVFAWGCALEKLAGGLDRLRAVHDRLTESNRDDVPR